MTTKKHLKRLVRSRAAQTGEAYATVLRRARAEQENRMSGVASTDEDVTIACSFCTKASTQVERLVAGPGVAICDECVALAALVVEEAAQASPEDVALRRAAHQRPSTADLLTALPALVRSAARVDAELTTSIMRLRGRGTDWQAIADAAGWSAEQVRRRVETAGPE